VASREEAGVTARSSPAASARGVSVVIPTFNGAAYITEALESVLEQTVRPAEIIVVDDCSTDDTLERVLAVEKHADVPIIKIRLEANSGGPAKPINVGIRRASGDLIAVLDQDDAFEPTKIEEQSGALVSDRALIAVFAWCRIIGAEDSAPYEPDIFDLAVARSHGEPPVLRLESAEIARLFLLRGMFIHGYPAFMFRRRAWEMKGGVDESLRIASDYDLMLWLASRGPVGVIPRFHYRRRWHASNVTTNNLLSAYLETLDLQCRHALGAAGEVVDHACLEELSNDMLIRSVRLRDAGEYQSAARYLAAAAKIRGWTPKLVGIAVKQRVHRALTSVRILPKHHTPWTRSILRQRKM
jgi:glycosyltransferase involved in cell wall biosynthesis